MPNFIQNSFDSYFDDCKVIPINWQPTSYVTITIEGWKKCEIEINDLTFNCLIELAKCNLECIILSYKETHAFSDPCFSWRPNDGLCVLKIGLMENELYDKLMKAKLAED